jgi:phosphatidylglycerol---prolipoprotein diacylglyceryl transferase
MHPVLVKLGPITIYSYGAMVALGFGIAAYLIYKHAARLGLNKEKVVDTTVSILVSGIIGARILYVLINLGYYTARPLEIFDLSKGGLVWYGGFIAGLLTAIIYIRVNKLDFWLVMDLIVPYVALAQAFGRIGCYLNGCCYGFEAPAGCTMAVTFPDSLVARYPTQLYSALLLLLIYVILRIRQELPHFKGGIFLGYCILYPLKRFIVEFFRGDNPRIFFGMTLSQVLSFAVFFAALVIFILKRAQWKSYLESK